MVFHFWALIAALWALNCGLGEKRGFWRANCFVAAGLAAIAAFTSLGG